MWSIEEELKQSEDFDFRADLMRDLNPPVAAILEKAALACRQKAVLFIQLQQTRERLKKYKLSK